MDGLAPALVFSAGAAIGSFVGTAALRAARGESAMRGRSRCDNCGRALGFAATLPLVSFALRQGACTGCRARIDLAHPLSELTGGAVALVLWLRAPWPAGIWMAAMAAALLAASVIDLRLRKLPDGLTLVVAAGSLALAVGRGTAAVVEGLAAAAVAWLVLGLFRELMARRSGDPGLGLGDVKLIAALALWLGVQTSMAVAMAAAVGLGAAVLVRPKDGRLPFGPALALSGWSLGVAMEVGLWQRWS